jgi:Tfp pilus assembly protein PilF
LKTLSKLFLLVLFLGKILIMRLMILIVTLNALFFSLSAQTDSIAPSRLERAMIPAKLSSARKMSDENNVRGALTEYRKVLDVDSLNYTALYATADCYYRLKKYKVALDYLKKAVATQDEIPADSYLFFGKCHHRMAELDKAIEYYEKYLPIVKAEPQEYDETRRFINECKFAKIMMQSKVPVTITNLGKEVNSRYEEYAPSITADGKFLYFTSRRNNTTGEQIDRKGDFKFFEDIYYCSKDAAGVWSEAEKVEGMVNTETHDGILSVLPNGKAMYIYKNDGKKAGDIWLSTKDENTGTFGAPVSLNPPINTAYFEGSTSVTEDGKFIYFVSEREKGLGRGDIYVSENNNGVWSTPKNLGNIINTEGDEKFVFIHPSGKSLYFASNGHLSLGGYDIFKSEWVDGMWTPPINLGYPINTVNEESTLSITRDNHFMYMAAEFENSLGERDLYAVDISQYPLIADPNAQRQYIKVLAKVQTKRGKPISDWEVYWIEENGLEIGKAQTDKKGVATNLIQVNKKYRTEIRDGSEVIQSDWLYISSDKTKSDADRTFVITLP